MYLTEHKANQNEGLLMTWTPFLCPCCVIEILLHHSYLLLALKSIERGSLNDF